MALIALGHSRCAFCDQILSDDNLVAASDGQPFIVPGLPYLHDNAIHQACFDRWPLRAVYQRRDLLTPGLFDPTWPAGARWAVVEWSAAHISAGLPDAARWVHPAHILPLSTPASDMWSLICEFEPTPLVQGTPSLARVRFAFETGPPLSSGTQLALYDPTFPSAAVYVL